MTTQPINYYVLTDTLIVHDGVYTLRELDELNKNLLPFYDIAERMDLDALKNTVIMWKFALDKAFEALDTVYKQTRVYETPEGEQWLELLRQHHRVTLKYFDRVNDLYQRRRWVFDAFYNTTVVELCRADHMKTVAKSRRLQQIFQGLL